LIDFPFVLHQIVYSIRAILPIFLNWLARFSQLCVSHPP
jgi:hypothetical protein